MSPESDLCEWCDGSAKPLQEASIGFSVDCPNGCKPRAVPESAPGAHGTHETCGKDHLIGEPCPVPVREVVTIPKAEVEQVLGGLRAEQDANEDLAHANRELRAERDRLISTNDTLVARIEDLNQGYGLEDTCPRVQCRSTSRRLKAQCERMSRAVEYALQGFSTDADAPFLAIFRKRYRKAMER